MAEFRVGDRVRVREDADLESHNLTEPRMAEIQRDRVVGVVLGHIDAAGYAGCVEVSDPAYPADTYVPYWIWPPEFLEHAEEQDTPSELVSRRLSACEAAMWRSGQAAILRTSETILGPVRGFIEQDHPELAGTAWDVAETEDGGLEFVTPA